VLEAVTPAALEVAFEVFDELRRRKVEVDCLRRAQVERAREDAELAQRQFMLVRPEHRLVADTLEQQWNEKLTRLAALEDDYARVTKTDGSEVNGGDRQQFRPWSPTSRACGTIRGRRRASGSACFGS
jgi:hypothetical protein